MSRTHTNCVYYKSKHFVFVYGRLQKEFEHFEINLFCFTFMLQFLCASLDFSFHLFLYGILLHLLLGFFAANFLIVFVKGALQKSQIIA